jgi:hypothetical protein
LSHFCSYVTHSQQHKEYNRITESWDRDWDYGIQPVAEDVQRRSRRNGSDNPSNEDKPEDIASDHEIQKTEED